VELEQEINPKSEVASKAVLKYPIDFYMEYIFKRVYFSPKLKRNQIFG